MYNLLPLHLFPQECVSWRAGGSGPSPRDQRRWLTGLGEKTTWPLQDYKTWLPNHLLSVSVPFHTCPSHLNTPDPTVLPLVNMQCRVQSVKYYIHVSCPNLCQGDEVLSVNGRVLQGLTHRQAILLFKEVRQLAIWTLESLLLRPGAQ